MKQTSIAVALAFMTTMSANAENLLTMGQPAIGSDMWTGYFALNGLFIPHDNSTCGNDAFVAISGTQGFCIEINARAPQHWEDARATCAAEDKRLPEPGEWKYACQLGLINLTGGNEWISNFATPYYNGSHNGLLAASGGTLCGTINGRWVAGDFERSDSFRCVH